MNWTAFALQAVGTLCFVTGVGLYSLPAGLIAAGIALVAFGLAAERSI
jgi:hypothetical protein